MNAKEARDAISFWESDSLHKSLDSMGKMLIAKGYLEALEGEEVKELVQTLDIIQANAPGPIQAPYAILAQKALANYREVAKK